MTKSLKNPFTSICASQKFCFPLNAWVNVSTADVKHTEIVEQSTEPKEMKEAD